MLLSTLILPLSVVGQIRGAMGTLVVTANE